MSSTRGLILTLVLSVLGAGLGAWGACALIGHARAQPPLHALLHHHLKLTPGQQASIEALEREHTAHQRTLEGEMRAANAELARAFEQDHAYTPRVQAAIDRFHHAMAQLQKETMTHILAMRRVLTADQAAQFDRTVVQSLSAESR